MSKYNDARRDHKILWDIAPAYDMSGGYVDQDDLARLLESPTKKTAADCLEAQICHWLHVGPDVDCDPQKSREYLRELLDNDPTILAIYDRWEA